MSRARHLSAPWILSAVVAVMAALGMLAVGLALPAYADEPATGQPVLTVAAIPAGYAGQQRTVALTVRDDLGQPVDQAAVLIERSDGNGWTTLATVTTDATGTATLPVTIARRSAQNAFRASLATHEPVAFTIGLLRRAGTLTLSGASRVVDERRHTWTLGWKATSGEPVTGPVVLQRRIGSGSWRTVATRTTGTNGQVAITLTPREDSQWRVQAASLEWVAGGTSAVRKLDNVAPGRPAKLPRKAPRPRIKLPTQPRAVGAGPNAVITAIPASIWRQMVGRTWHSGCPVGREWLRLIEVNYWDYTGYRRRGQLVVNVDVSRQIAAAMADLYRNNIPLRSVVREDRFGWSNRVRGANDYASMAAGNSSAFNCRDVVGRLGVRSPHAWGRALDLNTWENPYRSAKGTVPNRWWQYRSNKRFAWRSSRHIVVRIMKRHGLRWTYGLGDTQHFDAVPSRTSARTATGSPVIQNPTPTITCGMPVCE